MTEAGQIPQDTQTPALPAFAARMAHDFNNLLTGILGNLELLQLRAARQGAVGLEPYIEGANSAGRRAVAFAGRLMLYAGQGAEPPAAAAADTVLGPLSARAPCRLGAGAAQILCDAARLRLAVAELLTNAQEAGGAAVISSSAAAEAVTITVSDDGPGMAPEILARASAPFFTTAANATGRGLGLAIAGQIAGECGGRMEIAAAPGSGCTVSLILPRTG